MARHTTSYLEMEGLSQLRGGRPLPSDVVIRQAEHSSPECNCFLWTAVGTSSWGDFSDGSMEATREISLEEWR